MGDHAVLSAPSNSRWIHCPPSVRLSQGYVDKVGSCTLEVTSAHALVEYELKKLLGLDTRDPTEDSGFYDEEMDELTGEYAPYVTEVISKYESPAVLAEERLDLSDYVKESFGTTDYVVVGVENLHIVDLKYGQGILVDTKDNSQLMLYGLGALGLFDGIYDTEEIILHIYQPRRYGISTYEIKRIELYEWGEAVWEIAEKTYKGEGESSCEEWYIFCKVKNKYRKRTEENLKLAQDELTLLPELSDDEIGEILPGLGEFEQRTKDIKAYALERVLKDHGWKDLKLVEGRPSRRYRNEDGVIKKVEEFEFNPFEEKLFGTTVITKLLGKKVFDESITDLLEKPKGELTLVSIRDKREGVKTGDVKGEFGGFSYTK